MAQVAPTREQYEALVAENAAQKKRIAELEELVRDLRCRLKLDSTNSSMPPSSDPPWTARPRKPPTGRKPGGQPGHEGTTRTPFSAEEVDRRVPVFPVRCRRCRRRLGPGDAVGEQVRHQTVDLPPAAAEVTEYVLARCGCPRCGTVTAAELPEDAPTGVVGPRLQGVMAVLAGRFRLSRREVREAAAALFGGKALVSVGTVAAMETHTSAALAGPYREALQAVRSSASANTDETSWWEARRRAWLWAGVTKLLRVFRVDRRRSKAAFVRFLGDFRGVLGTDRWSAYRGIKALKRQLCWAHLLRNFKAIEERGGPAKAIGEDGRQAALAVMDLWRSFLEGEISRPALRRRLTPIRARLRWRLTKGLGSPDRKARAMCRDVLKWWPSLWTFARVDGVEPTNNAAERAVRKAVLWRKGSFGSASAAGSRFAERMLTAAESLRAQGRPVLDFVEAAIRAHQVGAPHPSLLPARRA